MYFVAILDSGPRCYECTDPVKFEECAIGRCIFNSGKCYYSGKQQDPFVYNKHGCIQPQYCNKIAEDGVYNLVPRSPTAKGNSSKQAFCSISLATDRENET